jgi:SAM-dependent methyltransferase
MNTTFSPSDLIRLRNDIFLRHWPLDQEITATAATLPSHRFLQNPSGQYAFIYLTQYLKVFSERHLGVPFNLATVLDWGCGKGHVSKLLRDLNPAQLESCDIQLDKADSAFGQQTPILERFQIPVTPLTHPSKLPYADASFDIIVSFGVLEHVANDAASVAEITRVLKPGGLFFCFFLPTKLSWTQSIARSRGDEYHDRLYTTQSIRALLEPVGLKLHDHWYRQIFPKNTISYPNFRLFERIDQFLTRFTPLRYFATNIEFVASKPR